MSSSFYPSVIEIPKTAFQSHKKTDSGEVLIDPEVSINPVGMSSELGYSSINISRTQTTTPQDDRKRVICYGVGGILLVVVANLIILGNNVLIKEYGIDYVDMILLRSTVQLLILGAVIKIQGKDLWIKEVDENRSIRKIRFLSFVQGIFSGFAIIGGYIFLFYMPLGLALVIIYAMPIVGIILPRLFPRKRFGKHLSWMLPVMLLVLCFTFLPLILYQVRTQTEPETQRNETNSSIDSISYIHIKYTFESNNTDNDDGDGTNDDSSEPIGIGMYYLGVGMALLISISDASHKIIVGYLYGNESTNSTLLTTYYAGYGGIVVGLVAAIFDKNQTLLSSEIKNLSEVYWGLLFGLAFLKLVTFLIINSAVKFIRPLVIIILGKYQKKGDNKE